MDQISATGQIITLVHLEANGKIACMPGMAELHATMYHPAVHRSDDPRAVTCPACKKSTVFVESLKRYQR